MSKFKPIELPRGKKYGSNYYITFSVKLQRNVILYSQLEYHNFLTLEMNPHVIEFCEQPLEIKLEIDGEIESSIFDMCVSYDNEGEEFIEVKYQKDLELHNSSNDRVFRQIQKQKRWCNLNNYNYSVRTDKDIYVGPYYISNLRYLHGIIQRNKHFLFNTYIEQIISHIKNSRLTILELTQLMDLPSYTLFAAIAFGIYTGKLDADIIKTVCGYDTSIWIT